MCRYRTLASRSVLSVPVSVSFVPYGMCTLTDGASPTNHWQPKLSAAHRVYAARLLVAWLCHHSSVVFSLIGRRRCRRTRGRCRCRLRRSLCVSFILPFSAPRFSSSCKKGVSSVHWSLSWSVSLLSSPHPGGVPVFLARRTPSFSSVSTLRSPPGVLICPYSQSLSFVFCLSPFSSSSLWHHHPTGGEEDGDCYS